MANAYNKALNRAKMPAFQFQFNEQDPELLLRRRRSLEETQRGRGRLTDEISRAGLLGSSASFDLLGGAERGGARMLEDIDADTMLKRRLEALELHREEQAFRRQLALEGYQQDNANSMSMMGAIGQIGEFAAGFIPGRNMLPRRSLQQASNYDYQPPQRRL